MNNSLFKVQKTLSWNKCGHSIFVSQFFCQTIERFVTHPRYSRIWIWEDLCLLSGMHECVLNFHFAAKEEEGMLYVIGNWNSLPRIQEKPSLSCSWKASRSATFSSFCSQSAQYSHSHIFRPLFAKMLNHVAA